MADDTIQLFSTDTNEIRMPFSDEPLSNGQLDEEKIKEMLKKSVRLASEGLDRAILGDTVKAMMIPEEPDVAMPNYVLDFTKVKSGEIFKFQIDALDALLDNDGDTTLYVYTSSGLAKLGVGKAIVLDRILTLIIQKVFDSQCKIYRDFYPGKTLMEVSQQDITTLRLHI